jgi:hypothetical protein
MLSRGLREDQLRVNNRETASDGIDAKRLVAAGVVLCGNQHQARAPSLSLLLRPVTECPQNADYGSIGRENAQAHGRDDGKEEDDGH